MIEILIALLVPVLIVGVIVVFVVRRGLQMRELCDNGVETTGQVISKRSVRASAATAKRQKLAYRYTDSTGAAHEHTSVVSWEIYNRHEEGSPIEVLYLPSKPSVSAPKYLVDQIRAGLPQPKRS